MCALNPAILKAYQKAAWGAGDYEIIGRMALVCSEELVEAVDVRAGQRVLDVACGGGSTALAAARRYCEVTAIDYVPALLEHGRRRAEVERLEVDFREGDAEAIPFADGSFDVVLSTFGSMFTPDHERGAGELLRVCRPGGKIGMTNWCPDGPVGDLFRAVQQRGLLPPNVQPPTLWGTEDHVRALFGEAVSGLQMGRKVFCHRYRSPEHYADTFLTYFGPAMKAAERMEPEQRAEFREELLESLRRHNISGDDTLVLPSPYLEVVAVRA